MADPRRQHELPEGVDFDLDEDLFNFGESSFASVYDDDDAELDEIFAAFQDAKLEEPLEELRALAQETGAAEELEPIDPVRSKDSRRAPAPEEVWTPSAGAVDQPRGARPSPSPRSTGGGGLSRTALWMLVAVTSLNGLVAAITLYSTATMRSSVLEVGRHVTTTADEIRTGAYDQARALAEVRVPVVAPDALNHPSLGRAREEIAQGEYVRARQRVYALLSVIDRLQPEEREQIEARAHFLLAEATHLEALARTEEDR